MFSQTYLQNLQRLLLMDWWRLKEHLRAFSHPLHIPKMCNQMQQSYHQPMSFNNEFKESRKYVHNSSNKSQMSEVKYILPQDMVIVSSE